MPRATEIVTTELGLIQFTIVGHCVWGREPYASDHTGDVLVYHCPICVGPVVLLVEHEQMHAKRGDIPDAIGEPTVLCGCKSECDRAIHPLLQRHRACRKL